MKINKSFLPLSVDVQKKGATLCIGLDIAWFGGSQNDLSSQFDFLIAALINPDNAATVVQCERVRLSNRDPNANLTFNAINELIGKFDLKDGQIVIAIDAPLQASPRKLPLRQPIPRSGQVQRRACEEYLNCKRKGIDNACGGAKGWYPNIQPGAPLAPRVDALLRKFDSTFKLWTRKKNEHKKLIIECFPAEAIWAAKRMGWFPAEMNAGQASAYKKQKGNRLNAQNVNDLVKDILLPFKNVCKQNLWKNIIDQVLDKILNDDDWKKDGYYPGGKMLDDVVDSTICLATAISYTAGNAHVWQDIAHPNDGHIIGPGSMQELFTGLPQLIPLKEANA